MSVENPSGQSSSQKTNNGSTACLACTILLVVATFIAALASATSYSPIQALGLVIAFGFAAVVCAILSVGQAVVEKQS